MLIVKTLQNVFRPWKSLAQGKCVLFRHKSVTHPWNLPVILFYILTQEDDTISLIVKLALEKESLCG